MWLMISPAVRTLVTIVTDRNSVYAIIGFLVLKEQIRNATGRTDDIIINTGFLPGASGASSFLKMLKLSARRNMNTTEKR